MNELDDFSLGTPRKLTAHTSTLSNAVLLLAIIIAVFVSIGEFTITLTGVVNVSVMVILIYVIASAVYRNSYASEIERCKSAEEFKSVNDEYNKAVKRIYDENLLLELPKYLVRYCEEDLKHTREMVLLDELIPYDLYAKTYRGKTPEQLKKLNLTDEAIRCIQTANNVKSIRINPSMLMSSGEEQSLTERAIRKIGIFRGVNIESKTRQQIDFIANAITRAFTTLITGAVGISVVMDDFSIRTLALLAVKMLPIAMAALGGTNGGKRNVHETLIPQLKRKTEIINIILTWAKTENKINEEQV